LACFIRKDSPEVSAMTLWWARRSSRLTAVVGSGRNGVEAILRNPELYQLAALIPQPSREKDQRVLERPAGRGRAGPQGGLEADAPHREIAVEFLLDVVQRFTHQGPQP
jgi:hypothetical protein